jgi:signal transduction histidine kinase
MNRRAEHAGARRGRGCGPRRPPWWPENEPWPSDRVHDVPGRRGRVFIRRIALLALTLFTIAVGGTSIVWHALTRFGVATAQRGAIAILVIVALAAIGAIVALVTIMRNVGMPLGAVMEGADRVAGGDYTTRVAEHGPPPIRALARAFNTMTERLLKHDRLRRDLMADVAHELRTPLTVMQGKLEGLLDGVYPRDDEQLAALVEETHVLSRLIEDLRTVALSESGALKLEKEPADLAAIARDVVEAFESEARERGVALSVDAPAVLPPLEVDPIRIREVIGNLLSNALCHTPAGGSVHVRVAQSGNGIGVEVRDTGSGMTADDIERAFERFHKGPESRGSGLGLTIARGLVTAHGGEIHASSERGGGTTMTFTLPRERAIFRPGGRAGSIR